MVSVMHLYIVIVTYPCMYNLLLDQNSSAFEMRQEEDEENAQWYERYQLVQGVVDGPVLGNRIPLECNLDLQHYISFTKGCYVGQELTARTKFKVPLMCRTFRLTCVNF